MKHFVSKNFRDADLIKKQVAEIHKSSQSLTLMEVCGSHTMAIGKWGIRQLLPANVRLISGPGCPVCVTPASFIDALIRHPHVCVAAFGDLLRVPGTKETLEQARAAGADVQIIYSPLEAVEIARKKETILAGIGFETTIPGIAHSIQLAAREKITNFSVLPAFKTVPNALKALLNDAAVQVDGFLLPGHASVITGSDVYRFIATDYNKYGVVCGFEPADILAAIIAIQKMQNNKQAEIVNMYARVVRPAGNKLAQDMINAVLEPADVMWRGLGIIPDSGLNIKQEYAAYDASKKYNIDLTSPEKPSACQCGDVLKGVITPPQCPLFGKTCLPSNPVGPCMVSSEGSCAADYKYEKH